MYVQEYGPSCPQPNTNRTYISYLDSVRFLVTEPPNQRTPVYHAIINGYLRNARDRGFDYAHIWVAPPQVSSLLPPFSLPPSLPPSSPIPHTTDLRGSPASRIRHPTGGRRVHIPQAAA